MTTILLTGLPRSGTTLLCALLNEMPNAIALAEPIAKLGRHPDRVIPTIDRFVAATRQSILQSGTAETKTMGGRITGNFMPEPGQRDGLRPSRATTTTVSFDKSLSVDFRLYIKHPAAFTAVLQELRRRYPVFAVVRNPLDVLASWQTVAIPVQRGSVPAGEKLDPELRRRLESRSDVLDRQVEILSWFLERYATLPRGNIVFHERLVRDPVSALRAIHPDPVAPQHSLYEQSSAKRYPDVDLGRLAKALLPIAEKIEPFYPDFVRSTLKPAIG
ncbi:MAG: sulfotransferase [Enhydrobacter sp.]|nr:sulfotransferase [Enhydrobacter sp.]